MPTIQYEDHRFTPRILALVEQANAIAEQYAQDGYTLTLRQVYYRLVAANVITNSDRSYKNLGEALRNARMAGIVDWDHIIDRGRFHRREPNWDSPALMVAEDAQVYQQDLWARQPYHVEVALEKDALVDVVGRVGRAHDVGYFSCRGYDSMSAVWRAAQRLLEAFDAGKERLVILHLGDHDPSGVDMTRDLEDRLRLFLDTADPEAGEALEVVRLALTPAQIQVYNLPPQPLKTKNGRLSDSRARGYVEAHGTQSWELDALEPAVIEGLLVNAVVGLRDADLWDEALEERAAGRARLLAIARRWDDVATFLA